VLGLATERPAEDVVGEIYSITLFGGRGGVFIIRSSSSSSI